MHPSKPAAGILGLLSRRLWRRWQRVSLLVITVLGSYPSRAQSYFEIIAETDTVYPPSNIPGVTRPTQIHDFLVCTVGTNEWRIDILERAGEEHWYYDGANVYDNILVPKKASKNSVTASATKTFCVSTTNVVSGVHIWESRDGCPLGNVRINIPWFAFCSGSFLRRDDRLIPLLPDELRHAPDSFAYSDQTLTFEDELGLPRSANLYASDFLFTASVNKETFQGKHDVSLWKRGSMGFKWDFLDGEHRFQYAVTEATNFLGLSIPLKFEWFLNVMDNGTLRPLIHGNGTVLSIRVCDKPASVIEPRLNPTIVDWRLTDKSKGVNGVFYQSTNVSALPTNDPKLLSTLDAWRKKGLAPPAVSSLRIRIFICMAFALPLIAVMLAFKKKPQEK